MTEKSKTLPRDDAKITQAELAEMFGKTIPMEAVDLLLNPPADATLASLRAQLREMAATSPAPPDSGLSDRELASIIYEWSPAYLSSALLGPNVWDFDDALKAGRWEAERAVERAGEIMALLARARTSPAPVAHTELASKLRRIEQKAADLDPLDPVNWFNTETVRNILRDAATALSAAPVVGGDASLAGRLLSEAAAMRKAVIGEETEGTHHASNWSDKPHRVLYDACKLIEEASAALSQPPSSPPEGELARLRKTLQHKIAIYRPCPDRGDAEVWDVTVPSNLLEGLLEALVTRTDPPADIAPSQYDIDMAHADTAMDGAKASPLSPGKLAELREEIKFARDEMANLSKAKVLHLEAAGYSRDAMVELYDSILLALAAERNE